MSHYLFILKNKMFKENIYLVSFYEGDRVYEKIYSYNTESVPLDYEIVFVSKVPNNKDYVEKFKSELDKHRISDEREFYECSIETIYGGFVWLYPLAIKSLEIYKDVYNMLSKSISLEESRRRLETYKFKSGIKKARIEAKHYIDLFVYKKDLFIANGYINLGTIEEVNKCLEDVWDKKVDSNDDLDNEIFIEEGSGRVYVLGNPALKENIYKVGFTTKLVEERIKQLSNTSVPCPYYVVKDIFVPYAYHIEQELHQNLDQYRVNANREFFGCEINTIEQAFYSVGYRFINHVRDIEQFINYSIYAKYNEDPMTLRRIIEILGIKSCNSIIELVKTTPHFYIHRKNIYYTPLPINLGRCSDVDNNYIGS